MPESEYADDPTIANDTVLWRRIRPEQWTRDADGRLRPTSQNFKDREWPDGRIDYISGYVAAKVPGGTDTLLADHPGYGVAAISAGMARAHGRGVVRDEENDGPGHCLLFLPEGRPSKASKKRSERLARESWWVILPPGLELLQTP